MLRNIIIKVASSCNIHCQYCYVSRSRDWSKTSKIMGLDILKDIVASAAVYCSEHLAIDRFVFYWHGGEPLLAGTQFFENAADLECALMPRGLIRVNSIQTNGLLLDRRWLRVLKNLNYNICVSLDGTKEIHDARRLSADGRGTYDDVVRSINLMKDEGWPIAILAVITPEAVSRGREIYHHFRELGCAWMDLMYPMCNLLNNTLDQPIEPAMWGQFYRDVFDAWAEENNPSVYVRQIHDWCMLLLGGKPELCTSQADCSYVITVDTDGDIYVCDDILPFCDSRLGNIRSHTLQEIDEHAKLRRLGNRSVLFGEDCLQCRYFPVCQGGCTLFRTRTKDDFSARHYFCDSQRLVIEHIRAYLSREIDSARQRQLASSVQETVGVA